MKNIANIFVILVLLTVFLSQPSQEWELKKAQASTAPLAAIETRGRIAVIDTGISTKQLNSDYMCKDMPVFTVNNRTGLDYNGHGTNVVGLIAERIDKTKYCITSYSMTPGNSTSEYMYFLRKVLEHGAVGVNISLEGPFVIEGEAELLEKITEKAKVFVAAGNAEVDLDEQCNAYPACYRLQNKKINVVGNRRFFWKYSNYGDIVNIWKDGVNKGFPVFTGSSQSTAIATGEFFSK
jgi:subtilisin family serine protease